MTNNNNAKTTKTIGFGFYPTECFHHFFIKITDQQVFIYERFTWDDEIQKTDIDDRFLKVKIEKEKFNLIINIIEKEFNRRLQTTKISIGRFNEDEIPVERLFGKELVLLLWAIEDLDIKSEKRRLDAAVSNWLMLSPEERWYLFTMTNAATGYHNLRGGWRTAIKYALESIL